MSVSPDIIVSEIPMRKVLSPLLGNGDEKN